MKHALIVAHIFAFSLLQVAALFAHVFAPALTRQPCLKTNENTIKKSKRGAAESDVVRDGGRLGSRTRSHSRSRNRSRTRTHVVGPGWARSDWC